jgi:methylphosphotriester-DNA--protein-cysteine methyltransferase
VVSHWRVHDDLREGEKEKAKKEQEEELLEEAKRRLAQRDRELTIQALMTRLSANSNKDRRKHQKYTIIPPVLLRNNQD